MTTPAIQGCSTNQKPLSEKLTNSKTAGIKYLSLWSRDFQPIRNSFSAKLTNTKTAGINYLSLSRVHIYELLGYSATYC